MKGQRSIWLRFVFFSIQKHGLASRYCNSKAWFRRYVFLMWKKEHVEMCICGFVFQRYGKSTYGFRIFRHLSCSVCIILTF